MRLQQETGLKSKVTLAITLISSECVKLDIKITIYIRILQLYRSFQFLFQNKPKKKSQRKNSKDELSKEKSYLKSLKISIVKSGRESDQEDPLTIQLSKEVDDALNFLDSREEFWKQMNVRKIH